MNIIFLRNQAKSFHERYIKNKEDSEDLHAMEQRAEFTSYFDKKFLENKLSLDNYCIGRRDNKTFCYKLEYGLKRLGSIKGGAAGKFIVYYCDKDKTYKTGKGYSYLNYYQAFELAKNNILKIYNAAQNDRIKDIDNVNFWYIIKYKIYWMYNPHKDIPVFKKDHVEKIIQQWHISSQINDASKREALFNFKNNDPVFSTMTNIEFMSFLYSDLSGLKLKDDKESESNHFDIINKDEETFLENFKGQYVDNESISKFIQENYDFIYKNIDYIKLNEKNKTLGTFGEYLIINDENRKLKALGIDKQIEHTSKVKGDYMGYDIMSYDNKSNEIYIEVKTTTKNIPDSFYLSENEWRKANLYSDKYFVYRVYNLNKKTLTYKVKIYSFKDLDSMFVFKPTNYLLEFKPD